MRAGVIVMASVLVACDSSQVTPDAVVVSPDATVIDSMPIDAPLDVAPTAWMIEVPETTTVFAAAVVPGAFVFGGRTELFRVSDDGAEVLRRPVPEGWDQYSLTATRDGDVYAIVWTAPDPQTRIVRLDGAGLDVEWTYVVGDGDDPYAKVVDAGDGRTIAVVSTHNWGGAQIWTLHDIDATGVGTTRSLDMPNGGVDALFVRDDGIVESSWRSDAACGSWQLDPADSSWTATPLSTAADCDDIRSTVTGAGLLVHALGGDVRERHEVAMIVGADGALVMPETLVAAGLVGRGTFVGAERIVGLESTRVWDAPRADPASARERILPLRPGGYALQSVMASDGERAFVAWLDQVSTFDTVLRVARLSELQ